MNELCPGCEPGTICKRHGIIKNSRQVEFCQGIADTSDGGKKYWKKWETDPKTAPDDPQPDAPGFPEGQVSERTHNPRTERSQVSKIGDRLKKIIEREIGIATPCSKCKKLILSLNGMTVAEARLARDESARQIADRAKTVAPKFWQRLAVTVDQALHFGETRRRIGGWIDEAIDEEENPKPKKASKRPVKTPEIEDDANVGKIPKRPKVVKTPPHVSFIEDHHGRPTDALDGLYPNGTAFLVCGGPSTREMDWSLLQQPGVLTASVNNAPCSKVHDSKDPTDMFRPHLWFSVDEPQHFQETIFKDPGVTKFLKIKFRKSGRLRTKNGKHWVKQKATPQTCANVWYYRHTKNQDVENFLAGSEPTWWTNPNRSVMFIAFRILFYLGIRRLYLIGCDFHQDTKNSYGFDDPMPSRRANYNTDKFERLNDIFSKLRPHFEEFGFQILNCTPGGNLVAFDRVPLDIAIADATASIPEKIETRGLYLK